MAASNRSTKPQLLPVRDLSPIRRARLSRGLTLFDVSRAVGYSETSLSRVERGQLAAPPDVLKRIRAVLDLDA